MLTKSFTSPRRFSGYALILLLCCCFICKRAGAQVTTPLVTASFATGLTHPAGWGTIYQTAIDTNGDLLVVDTGTAALYEFPANGGAMITLVPAGGLSGNQNAGIAIDSMNALYLEGNWNNCLLRFPYDTTTQTWDGLATLTKANPSSS